MRRLFAQIYLAFVLIVLLFFALSALSHFLLAGDHPEQWQIGTAAALVEQLLPPPGASRAALEERLREWHQRLDADLEVRRPGAGGVIARAGLPIETWVAPANVSQEGPARIVSYSGGTTLRNFTLGQTQYNYDFLNRNVNSDANGDPANPDFSVFESGETFQSFEIGYALSQDNPFLNNIHVTAWSVDGRAEAG